MALPLETVGMQGTRPRVLVVEDELHARAALLDLLDDSGYEALGAADGRQALDLLERESFDLIISDIRMPGADGFEVTRRLRQNSATTDTPLILVSALSDPDHRVHALDIGADDFLSKPIEPDELLARVRAHLRRAMRHTAALRKSVIDELTGALNRRGAFEMLERQMQKAAEDHTCLSLLLVDVDNFKDVNDTFGHAAGDGVLVRTADLLRENAVAADAVGRLGGDEFLLALPMGKQAADAVRRQIGSVSGPGARSVTLTAGLATWRPGEPIDELLARADAAMYRRKRTSHIRRAPRRDSSPDADRNVPSTMYLVGRSEDE